MENNDDLLKKDLEIAQLNLKIKSYQMQIKMINSFVNQVNIRFEQKNQEKYSKI